MSKVMFTQPAEYDLIGIEDYIRDTLCNPDAAIKLVDGIIEIAEKLALFSKRASIY